MASSHRSLTFSDFSSPEQLDQALAVAPPRYRLSLLIWQYVLLRLQVTGEARPRYEIPFNFLRFLRVRPLIMVVRWAVWAVWAISCAWWLRPTCWAATPVLLGVLVWNILDTVHPQARAMRKIWAAVKVDEQARRVLLDEALRLETQA